MRPVVFASRSLTTSERNYYVTDKECLAIIHALRKFEMYVEGTEFTVETDHMALTGLSRLREASGKLARGALILQRLEFEVRYRKGATNVVADALSRAPVNDTQSAGQAEEDADGQPPVLPRGDREAAKPPLPRARASRKSKRSPGDSVQPRRALEAYQDRQSEQRDGPTGDSNISESRAPGSRWYGAWRKF